MTPIPESLREKWTKEARDIFETNTKEDQMCRMAFDIACEKRHAETQYQELLLDTANEVCQEYRERIGQLEGLLREADEIFTGMHIPIEDLGKVCDLNRRITAVLSQPANNENK